MSATFTINNFSPSNILEKAQLNADVAVSASPVALTLVSNNSIAVNDYIVIGPLGSESSELKQVSAVSGSTSVTVPTVSNAHLRYQEVTKLFGNSITVYRAPNVTGAQPADSAFVTFSGNTVAIDPDQPSTLYTDSTGSNAFWYKFVYTNTTSSASTSLSDSSAARGQGYGNYAAINDIRVHAGFQRSRGVTDAMIDMKRQAAQGAINSRLVGVYTIPFTDPVPALISDITIRLAAGWLLQEQYDPSSNAGQKGRQMVESVTNDKNTGDLDKLQKSQSVLTDATGAAIVTSSSASGVNGWPNDTTADADFGSGRGTRMFRVGDIEGYNTRRY